MTPFLDGKGARALLPLVAWALSGCGGSTGDDHLHFTAQAAGPADAAGPMEFTTRNRVCDSQGNCQDAPWYHIVLTRARLHIGGLYLNQTVPLSGRQAAGCYLTGIYVGQVRGAVDLDLLSPTPVAFPVAGDGVALEAHAAEVWLVDHSLDVVDETTAVLTVEGTADRDGSSWSFAGAITINGNWLRPPPDSTQPSAYPICLERIVSPIVLDRSDEQGHAVGLTLREGATLLLRVDPRSYFLSVDFATLPPPSDGSSLYRLTNTPSDDADRNLYKSLHDTSGVYEFTLQ